MVEVITDTTKGTANECHEVASEPLALLTLDKGKFKTIYVRVESESQVPEGAEKSLIRQHLFGCYHCAGKETVRELGILETEYEVTLFVKRLTRVIVELLNSKAKDFYFRRNMPLKFERKANVTVYFLEMEDELDELFGDV